MRRCLEATGVKCIMYLHSALLSSPHCVLAMSLPLAASDPARIIARIQYDFLRHQMLTSQVVGVDSKASAREWALGFHNCWVRFGLPLSGDVLMFTAQAFGPWECSGG